jgi:hypothetical protein
VSSIIEQTGIKKYFMKLLLNIRRIMSRLFNPLAVVLLVSGSYTAWAELTPADSLIDSHIIVSGTGHDAMLLMTSSYEKHRSGRAIEPGTWQNQFLRTFTNNTRALAASLEALPAIATCTPPGAQASVSRHLNCTYKTVTLMGTSGTSGVSYAWSGPGFSSALQNPPITAPGLYTLTVTNQAGCTSTSSVEVQQNITLPGATAGVSDILTCSTDPVRLLGGTTTGTTFRWIGPNGIIFNEQNPVVTVSGGYTLNVTNTANGCVSTATTFAEEDKVLPGVTATGTDVLTCLAPSVELSATSPTEVTYQWTGPQGFTSDEQNPFVELPGTYTVAAINPVNHCKSQASVTIQADKATPGAEATVSGQINCAVASVTLRGSSPTSDISYSWSGPSFTSSPQTQNVTASKPGTHILTVTKASNGCTSTSQVEVIQDKTRPGATASPSGLINCEVSTVTLRGTTSASNATYRWISPSGVIYTDQNLQTATPGAYSLTVTNPANLCTSSTVGVVVKDITAPAGVTASAVGPGSLTCSVGSVNLNGNTTSTRTIEHSWSGPGVIADPTLKAITITAPGTYTFTVKDLTSACLSSASVTVLEDKDNPGVMAEAFGKFTCTTSSVSLNAASETEGLAYAWSPNVPTPNVRNPVITTPGTYTVVVTDPTNGCTSTGSVTVGEDKNVPGVTASVIAGGITCDVKSATLLAISQTADVLYDWTGPEGYESTEDRAVTTVAGSYTVTATNPANGCTSDYTIVVETNTTPPADVRASKSSDLTCTEGSVILKGESTTSNVSYSWAGPEGYTATAKEPEIFEPGIYRLTVKASGNGCITTAEVEVEEDTEAPVGVIARASSDLSCKNSSVTLSGESSTANVSYLWTRTDGTTSTAAVIEVSTAGTYRLDVLNTRNGCSETASVTVLENRELPRDVDASVTGPITCATDSVSLQGRSTTTDATFHWEGPNGFVSNEQNPLIAHAGEYVLTVMHPLSGCTATDRVTVVENRIVPEGVDARVSGILNCDNTSVTLTGESSTSGVEYKWTSADGTVVSTLSSTSVSAPGEYTLTVTNTQGQCSATDRVVVEQNIIKPEVTTAASGVLTCSTPNASLNVTGGSVNWEYSWTGPNGFTSNTTMPVVADSGRYTLRVKNPVNGCENTYVVPVAMDKNSPQITVVNNSGNSLTLTCYVSPLTFTGSTSTPGASIRWTGSNGFESTQGQISVTTPASYVFTVTGANGCQVSRTRNVNQNLVNPIVTANPSSAINCDNSTITLTGTSTGSSITYTWTGPAGFPTTTGSQVTTSIPGDYKLTVTTPGGCAVVKDVTVVENLSDPEDVEVTVSNAISCAVPFATLTATSSTADVTYEWIGPNEFYLTEPAPMTIWPGDYVLTVEHPESGCNEVIEVSVPGVVCDETVGRVATADNSLAPAGVLEESSEPGDLRVNIYPNPIRDKATIAFTAGDAYGVSVEIYSLVNIKVATLYNAEVEPGNTYQAVWETSELASGIYIYRITYAGGKKKEGRLIVVH